ncbi:hypothetical protein ETR14_01760 [Sphingosinicella sp. BN140058]|nr:hypothetical protein ETR14_01760 [Sphingosinicella sp. BN140058]
MRLLLPLLLAPILAIGACSPAPAPRIAASEAQYADLRETRWNGLVVRAAGTPDDAALLFANGRRTVHRERDPGAQAWGLFPPRDLDGDDLDDLHAWFWSGGAHCCITHLVYPGTMGARPVSPPPAWRLVQGDGDPIGFTTIPDHPRPLLILSDASSAYVSGAFADTPSFPFFVEAGPNGLRLAEALMRSVEPGGGPAVLRDGPPGLAAAVGSAFGSEIAQTGRIPPPAERIRVLRARLDGILRAKGPGTPAAEAIAAADLLPDIERHIKLYCVYDPYCDIPALAAEIEGGRPGVLGPWLRELDQSWRASPLYALKRRDR